MESSSDGSEFPSKMFRFLTPNTANKWNHLNYTNYCVLTANDSVCTPSPVVFLRSLPSMPAKIITSTNTEQCSLYDQPFEQNRRACVQYDTIHTDEVVCLSPAVFVGRQFLSLLRLPRLRRYSVALHLSQLLTPPLATACNCTLKQTVSDAYPAAAEPFPTQTGKRGMCFDV